ncbi:MAG: hypothetical protein RI983_1854 [Bacteroidota bacterium]|jgi:transcriptional regulator with XRE-family HTH domain
MMEKTNIKWSEFTDNAILNQLGAFIKETRLTQNKTQQALATAAGVNRSTIVQLENGNSATLISFIQVLRALGKLDLFERFQQPTIISPLLLAKQELSKKKRATLRTTKIKPTPKSNW